MEVKDFILLSVSSVNLALLFANFIFFLRNKHVGEVNALKSDLNKAFNLVSLTSLEACKILVANYREK